MGTHTFEIVRYNLKKGMGISNFVQFVQSAIFTVGGHSWAIRFYPNGVTEGTRMFASVALVLMDEGAKVRAFYDLFLVNQIECWSESIMCSESTATKFVACNYFVARKRKLELPSNGYIQNNRMNIQCDLTVVRDSELFKTKGGFKIQVPLDLSEHFSRLLLDKEEANVIFSVRAETVVGQRGSKCDF
jgi:speckle-type POZ protein